MLTIKQLRHPVIARNWTVPKPKYIVQAIAFTALAALVLPNVGSFINHQLQVQAADGRSCFRVSADRKSQVRKYGSECDL